MRLRAFLTTLVTLIIGRAVFDILVINYGTAGPDVAVDLRHLGLHRRRHGLRLSPIRRSIVAVVIAIIAHIVADALAARLACPGGRRLAPLGATMPASGCADRLHSPM